MTSMHPWMACSRRCSDTAAARHPFGSVVCSFRNAHLLAVAELEADGDHRDPFDRLLVCQSRTEPMLLLSADRQLRRYGNTVNVIG